ncbi:hypothetical protein B0A55_13245 [Friedmanniomyces simplex]|uniref:Uncharacterized protein n=1 Tax=Friedmanniomyces simplex TaxID=329884 RepID=A0A4U0WTN0_9PEZI|nr:hypothetical protein B0A55_13245 [Friedmanniomyces simplex]
MYQSNSGTSKRQRDSGLAGSSFTGKTGTTGPYDPQFEQLLIDHGVYPDGYEDSNGNAPEPENIQAIRERLARSRSSLSPSHFDEAAFKQFQRTNRGVSTEQDVMEDVFPTIRGNTGTRFHKAGNTPFNNLVEFAPGITDAKVDGYDGARPMEIELAVRRDLHGYIIPSTRTDLPAAPNHLTEVKGPAGRSDVLRRQAMYAGAVGARGMFELQNYGSETPVYDGNAYALVPTYHAGEGSLRVYATHPRQSAVGQTEYHMTQLGSYAMTHSSESFRQGAAALRNSRDLSKEQRDRFIASANATARRLPPAATPSSGTAGAASVPGVRGVKGVSCLTGIIGVNRLGGVIGVNHLSGIKGVNRLSGVKAVDCLSGAVNVNRLSGIEAANCLCGLKGVHTQWPQWPQVASKATRASRAVRASRALKA